MRKISVLTMEKFDKAVGDSDESCTECSLLVLLAAEFLILRRQFAGFLFVGNKFAVIWHNPLRCKIQIKV